MNNIQVVWIASYPRSGNTFLRTILWQCFGLPTGSVYPNDLGDKKELKEYVGHLDYDSDGQIRFPENSLPLVKTHEPPRDGNPAIYIVRDGRAACVSLWNFYKGKISLAKVIEGQHQFGTWSNHVQAWDPLSRPNTLFLEYEEMRTNLPQVLNKIGHFLGRDIVTSNIPDRSTIAQVDGRIVRNKSDWTSQLDGELLERFNQINMDTLQKFGYLQ